MPSSAGTTTAVDITATTTVTTVATLRTRLTNRVTKTASGTCNMVRSSARVAGATITTRRLIVMVTTRATAVATAHTTATIATIVTIVDGAATMDVITDAGAPGATTAVDTAM